MAMAGVAADGISPSLWLLHNTTLLWQNLVGQGSVIAVDATHQLLWVPSSTGGTTLEAYSYSGALVRSVSAAGSLATPASVQFIPDSAGGSGSLAESSGVDDVITVVEPSTGATSVLYNGFHDGAGGPEAQVVDFALSADSAVLYIAGTSAAAPYGGVWVVDTASSVVLAQLDLQSQYALLVAVNVDEVLVPTASYSLMLFAPAGAVQPFHSSSTGSASTGVSSVLGDPSFVGLLGQRYQVHGLDGAVYSLVTDDVFARNARFVFLDSGRCPESDRAPSVLCWSHPGSYLGELGVRSRMSGERISIISGAAASGFHSVSVDYKQLAVGSVHSSSELWISWSSSHRLQLRVGNFHIDVETSNRFVNLANVTVVQWSRLASLHCHGLLGQTWKAPTTRGLDVAPVEGLIDDYVITSNDSFDLNSVPISLTKAGATMTK